MAGPPVLRFPISGRENEYFLLEVSSDGSRPLDLKLVGSESTAVFVTKLRQRKTAEYKHSSNSSSKEDWEETLASILVKQQLASDIEIRADVQSAKSKVTLSFQKKIEGLALPLGSITLEESEETEISPFDWCVSAIATREKVQEDLNAATIKIRSLEESLGELRDQLDELVKAKAEDETQLLEKFRNLLNEKKVKIRQQQRLLASAEVNPEKLAKVGGSLDKQKHVAQASRPSKRKVKKEVESSDDGFEKMDVDEKDQDDSSVEPDAEGHGDTTPDDTPSGTDTDDDDEPAPPAQSNVEAPPPRRNLPFMKNKPSAPPPKPVDNDETESDEEL